MSNPTIPQLHQSLDARAKTLAVEHYNLSRRLEQIEEELRALAAQQAILSQATEAQAGEGMAGDPDGADQ